jgi:ribosomal protein S6--L-glutamate ligase
MYGPHCSPPASRLNPIFRAFVTWETAIDKANFILGRKEWVSLHRLGLPAIKAKVDTGARTSSLHARNIETYGEGTKLRVKFIVHPIPLNPFIEVACDVAVKDIRDVASSNGEKERRCIIETALSIDGREWPIELGLTNREAMTHRMLIGRQAIPADVLVNPADAFRHPRLSAKVYKKARAR